MICLLDKALENIASLRHFYDIQKKYIDTKSKKGMNDNKMGFLTDFYFNVLVNSSEEEKQQSTFKNLKKAMDKYITVHEVTKKGVTYEIKDRSVFNSLNISSSAKEYQKYAEMPITHGNNTLIMLITRFEEFISDFIEILYQKYPNKYLDNQTITFSEIAQNGVENIRTIIVDREVERIMRESFSSWFKLFENHKMSFDNCKAEYNILKELYARRNILVHNSGIVNESYIKNVPDTTHKIGEKLYADDKYLNTAFDSIKTIIFCILIEGARLENGEKETYLDCIFNGAFGELMAENYHTCETVFNSIFNSKFSDEKTKYMALINYWISKIENGGFDNVKTDIQKLDVSALDKIFLVAKHILLREYKDATHYIDELYKKEELPFYALEEWPLFRRYKNSAEYATFKSSHPELSGVVALETKSENLMKNDGAKQSVKTALEDASK